MNFLLLFFISAIFAYFIFKWLFPIVKKSVEFFNPHIATFHLSIPIAIIPTLLDIPLGIEEKLAVGGSFIIWAQIFIIYDVYRLPKRYKLRVYINLVLFDLFLLLVWLYLFVWRSPPSMNI